MRPQNTAEIQLTKGFAAIVDAHHYSKLSQFSWHISIDGRNATGYARRRRKITDDASRWLSKNIFLHHSVLDIAPCELPPDHVIDHIDQNSLNCRALNLRIIHETINKLIIKNWRGRKLEKISMCAECSHPIPATHFLCWACDTETSAFHYLRQKILAAQNCTERQAI